MNRHDPGFFLGIGATQDRRYLLLSVHDQETAEISLIDAADLSAPPRLVSRARLSTTTRSIIMMGGSSS